MPDEWDAHGPDHLAKTFIETTREARVTYRGEDGKRFRVIVRQRPNPVGFRAVLPGDANRAQQHATKP
jgi:hypothetical protein